MLRLVRAAMLIVAVLPLAAATCVTEVRQKGPAGPWVGEVVNTGPYPVKARVYGEVFDATGRRVDAFSVPVCPGLLMPGETGAFEAFADPDVSPLAGPEPVLPLRADFRRIAYADEAIGSRLAEGLTAREVDRRPGERYVLAEIRNESARTYGDIGVCATLRLPDGRLAEVGSADLAPLMLRPGESSQFRIYFNSMPPGTFESFADARHMCCPERAGSRDADLFHHVPIGPDAFTATASRITRNDEGDRFLEVIGEIENPTDFHLHALFIHARIAGSPDEDAIGVSPGCDGRVPPSGKAAVTLSIPLATSIGIDHSDVVVDLAAAYTTFAYTPPVEDVRVGPRDQGVRNVTAMIHNPTASWIELKGGCFNLRDDAGRLVGTYGPALDAVIEPGGSIDIDADVVELERSTSADVIVIAEAVEGRR